MSDIAVIAILITVLIALLGFAFGYGVLTNKVVNHERDINELKKSFGNIDTKLDAICNDVAVIKAEALKDKG